MKQLKASIGVFTIGSPLTLKEGTFATEALQLMQGNNISQLVIIDLTNKPIGFVHLHDLLKEGIV